MIGDFFSAIIAKLVAIVQWFADIFVAIFVALWDLVKDAFAWVADQLLGIVQSAISAIDVSAFAGFATVWGTAPAEFMNILSLLGVGTATTIILTAIGIRLALQLIPFVRLGS